MVIISISCVIRRSYLPFPVQMILRPTKMVVSGSLCVTRTSRRLIWFPSRGRKALASASLLNQPWFCCSLLISVTISRNLQDAGDSMTRLSTGLDDVDKQVAVLREKMAVSTREASEIEIGLKKARQTLSVSQNLVAELQDEYLRWQKQVSG